MATRSMIGYINKNNRVKLGYCHYDGDLEHNGIILQYYYNNMEIVKNLSKQVHAYQYITIYSFFHDLNKNILS